MVAPQDESFRSFSRRIINLSEQTSQVCLYCASNLNYMKKSVAINLIKKKGDKG